LRVNGKIKNGSQSQLSIEIVVGFDDRILRMLSAIQRVPRGPLEIREEANVVHLEAYFLRLAVY